MTRECDERMWNLAYRLAQSGEHQNYQAIEWELRASGFRRARQLLDHERVREKLDGMCAEARAIREHLVVPDTDSLILAGSGIGGKSLPSVGKAKLGVHTINTAQCKADATEREQGQMRTQC